MVKEKMKSFNFGWRLGSWCIPYTNVFQDFKSCSEILCIEIVLLNTSLKSMLPMPSNCPQMMGQSQDFAQTFQVLNKALPLLPYNCFPLVHIPLSFCIRVCNTDYVGFFQTIPSVHTHGV